MTQVSEAKVTTTTGEKAKANLGWESVQRRCSMTCTPAARAEALLM